MIRSIRRFLRDRSANFSVIVAVVSPVLLGLAGLSLDYARLDQARSALQEAADGAALAGANELILASSSDAQIAAVAENHAVETLIEYADVGEMQVKAARTASKTAVEVEITFQWTPMLAQLFDDRVTPIRVSARADTAGTGMACVIALMNGKSSAKSAIRLDNSAKLIADECSVFSNSVDAASILLKQKATMSAANICSAGGVSVPNKASVEPTPITDCPPTKDPLANRKPPASGACVATKLAVKKDAVLEPGTYCGGLKITNSAVVRLKPGIYVIKDGEFRVGGGAALSGENVGFFFSGADAVFRFEKQSTIDISAPKTGPMAGLLMMEDPALTASSTEDTEEGDDSVRHHKITSDDARNLLGAIYLPKSVLLVDASSSVAAESPWTAIIVGRLRLSGGPALVLNGDYADSDIPVPNGIVGKRARLLN